jgi:carbon-monoxide dehydrogenase large subunit
MPCTPERVWQTVRDAEAGAPPDPWREPPAVFATLRSGQAADEEGVAAAEGI